VKLEWEEPTTDREALALILKASFLTKEGMIYLPGQGFGPERRDVLIAAHNAYCQSFLQHAKKRPGQGVDSVTILDEDGIGHAFSYKKVDRYSHQTAQGTSLLGEKWDVEPGDLPDVASVPQNLIPGATGGARDLAITAEQAFLLHFLMVACPVFSVRSRKWEAKVQNCLVVPDVTNLKIFSMRLVRVGTDTIRRHTNSYLGRIVGGAEEAAMRFLIDLKAIETGETLGVSGAQVCAMGKVAWDGNQQNRSRIARIKDPSEYPDFAVFEAAAQTMGRAKVRKNQKGESYTILASSLPDLIAANLAAGGRWYDGFRELVAKKNDFVDLSYRREGFEAMRDAIQDEVDQLVISLFQEAWDIKRNALSDRAHSDHLDYWKLVDGERERIRNSILRCKSPDMLIQWLLAFAADARRKEPIGILSRQGETLRKFLFNPRNADRVQNLLLFALVSSPSTDPKGRASRPTQEG